MGKIFWKSLGQGLGITLVALIFAIFLGLLVFSSIVMSIGAPIMLIVGAIVSGLVTGKRLKDQIGASEAACNALGFAVAMIIMIVGIAVLFLALTLIISTAFESSPGYTRDTIAFVKIVL